MAQAMAPEAADAEVAGQILGISRTAFKEGVARTTIRLYEGATPLTLIEEKLEGDASVMMRDPGKRAWLLEALRDVERKTGSTLFRTGDDAQVTDNDIKEAWSHLGQGYFVGRSKKGDDQMLASWKQKGFRQVYADILRSKAGPAMQAYGTFFRSVWRRGAELNGMRRAGTLDADLEGALRRSLGMGEQSLDTSQSSEYSDDASSEPSNIGHDIGFEPPGSRDTAPPVVGETGPSVWSGETSFSLAPVSLAEPGRASSLKATIKSRPYPAPRLAKSDNLLDYWNWFAENLLNRPIPTPLGRDVVFKEGHFRKLIAGGRNKGAIPGVESWTEAKEKILRGEVSLIDDATMPEGFEMGRTRQMSNLVELFKNPALILRDPADNTLHFVDVFKAEEETVMQAVTVSPDGAEVYIKSWRYRHGITENWLSKLEFLYGREKWGVDMVAQPPEGTKVPVIDRSRTDNDTTSLLESQPSDSSDSDASAGLLDSTTTIEGSDGAEEVSLSLLSLSGWLEQASKSAGYSSAEALKGQNRELYDRFQAQWKAYHGANEEKKRSQDTAINDIDNLLYGTSQHPTTPSRRPSSGQSRGEARTRLETARQDYRRVFGPSAPPAGSPAGGGQQARTTQRRRERAWLVDWAREQGLLIHILPAHWKPDGEADAGQMEHHVFSHGDRVVKITKGSGDFFGLWPVPHQGTWDMRREEASIINYLDSMANANALFGDDMVVQGVLADRDGGVKLIISQPDIEGDTVNTTFIGNAMAEVGFVQLVPPSSFYRASDNMAVIDLHQENAARAGNLMLPFDVKVLHPTGVLRENLECAAASASKKK